MQTQSKIQWEPCPVMETQTVEFRVDGEPAKIDRFYTRLGQMGIPVEANRIDRKFKINSQDFVRMQMIASILSVSPSATN